MLQNRGLRRDWPIERVKMRKFLHVGCGPGRKGPKTPGFDGPEWAEIRLDIDPSASPDLIGTITDLSAVETGAVDAVYSSHNIEHIYPHEVSVALAEFRRVLNPEGFLSITCPDVVAIAKFIAARGLEETAYVSGMGPITPLDMLYGHRASLRAGNLFMAHRTAFSAQSMLASLQQAGFGKIAVVSRPSQFLLWAVASKAVCDDAAITALAQRHIPGFTAKAAP